MINNIIEFFVKVGSKDIKMLIILLCLVAIIGLVIFIAKNRKKNKTDTNDLKQLKLNDVNLHKGHIIIKKALDEVQKDLTKALEKIERINEYNIKAATITDIQTTALTSIAEKMTEISCNIKLWIKK